MGTAYSEALIQSALTDDIVSLAILCSLAGLLIFAISVQAGNYPKFSAAIGRTRSALRRLRSQRWHGESISS